MITLGKERISSMTHKKNIRDNVDVFEYRLKLKIFSHKKIPQRQLKISNQLREDT